MPDNMIPCHTVTVHQGGAWMAYPVGETAEEAIGTAVLACQELLEEDYTMDLTRLGDGAWMLRGASVREGYPVPQEVTAYILPAARRECV